MNTIKRQLLNLSLLLALFLITGCEHDTHFIEDRIVGRWISVEEDYHTYVERTLTFTAGGDWSGTIRIEDKYGISIETDMGVYDIRHDELLLESYIYDDVQVYGVEIRNNRLYLWDDNGETVYTKY